MSEVIRLIKKSDVEVFFFLNNKLQHCKILSLSMRLITQLGSTIFSVALCIYLLFQSQKELYMFGWLMTCTLIISQIIVQTLKRVVNRPRPYCVLQEANAKNPPKCRYSFPSGHTCAAFCIAIVLSLSFPYYSLIFFILAFIVGISRIYLGYHYPTDVLIGGVLAVISFVIVYYQMIPLIN